MATIKLPHQECYDALKEVAKNKGFGPHTLQVSLGSKKNENFLGDIYRVKISEKEGDKKISVIIKIAPGEISRDEVPLDLVYQREILSYRLIFKIFQDLEKKYKIPADFQIPLIECYYTSDKTGKEMIIIEDLKEKDFVRLSGVSQVGLDHATQMVTYLAKFHSMSYVMKKNDLNEFMSVVKQVPDYTNQVRNFVSYCEKSLEIAIKCITNKTYAEKLRDAKKRFGDKLTMAAKSDEYSVICHSDCYLNNIMFRMQNGDAVESRLIDFQFARYGSPAVDLVYMLLSSTQGRIRQMHYRTLITIYYETMRATLRAYKIQVEEVLPEDVLQRQINENAIFGLVAGVALFRSMSVARYEAAQAGRPFAVDQVETPKGTELDIYRNKVTELVRDCIEYGYI